MFTDHLLLNLLSNLVAFPRLFRSKDAVVEFSEKVEAERILGAKPRVRPKDLRFIGTLPRPESRLKIEYRVGEWQDLPDPWRDEAQGYDGDPKSEPSGYVFRVSNSGSIDVPVRDAYISDHGVRVIDATSRLPSGRWLQPGESAIFIVPGWELARKLLERGRSGSAWPTFMLKESVGKKPHKKSFEVTDLEQRAASTPEDLE